MSSRTRRRRVRNRAPSPWADAFGTCRDVETPSIFISPPPLPSIRHHPHRHYAPARFGFPVVSIRLPRSPKPVSPGSSIICTDAITATLKPVGRPAARARGVRIPYASNWTTRSMRARLLRQRSNHVCLPNGGSTPARWEDTMCDLCRRRFMRGTAALLGAGAFPTPLFAQAQTSAAERTVPAPLPARGDFVIRNGYVLTMEAALASRAGRFMYVTARSSRSAPM